MNRCTEGVKTKIHVDKSKQRVTKLTSIKQKSGEKITYKFVSEQWQQLRLKHVNETQIDHSN